MTTQEKMAMETPPGPNTETPPAYKSDGAGGAYIATQAMPYKSTCSICSKPFAVGARYVYVDHGQGSRPVHVGCPRVVEGSAVVYIASEDGPTDDMTTVGQLSDISSPEYGAEPEETPEPTPEPTLEMTETLDAAMKEELTGVTLNHERGGTARAQVGDWVLVKTLYNPAKIKAFVDLLHVEVESPDSGPVKVLTALCTLCDMSKPVAGLDSPPKGQLPPFQPGQETFHPFSKWGDVATVRSCSWSQGAWWVVLDFGPKRPGVTTMAARCTATGATGELTPAPYRVGDWVRWKKSGLNREGRGQVLTCEADQDAWVLTVTGLELELLPSDIVKEPQGVKHDTKKPRWTLVPWASVSAIVEVLEYGAQKYAPDNWRKVENGRERYANAALRHIMAWLGGERCDPESGLPHLAHAGCCILFLLDVDRVTK